MLGEGCGCSWTLLDAPSLALGFSCKTCKTCKSMQKGNKVSVTLDYQVYVLGSTYDVIVTYSNLLAA